MSHYLKASLVRRRVRELEHRISKDGIAYLDVMIDRALEDAARIHNGGRKTIDETVLRHVVKASNR